MELVGMTGVGQDGVVKFERDDVFLRTTFFMKPVVNALKTKEQGYTVYEDKEYVEIKVPSAAGTLTVICRPVEEDDKQRFAEKYAKFKSKSEKKKEGLPIEEWPPVPPSIVKQLESVDIVTVEQLAKLPDNMLKFLGSDYSYLRDKAARFLKAAEDGKELSKLSDELKKAQETIEFMKQQMEEMKVKKK